MAGSYRVLATVQGQSASDDSFWAAIDGGPQKYLPFDAGPAYSAKLVDVRMLTVGDHTIAFAVREDGARLDRVELRPL